MTHSCVIECNRTYCAVTLLRLGVSPKDLFRTGRYPGVGKDSMCHHWTYDSVEERLAEREEAEEREHGPEIATELDREHRGDPERDDRERVEVPPTDD